MREGDGKGAREEGKELDALYFLSFFEAKDARNNFAGLRGILGGAEY